MNIAGREVGYGHAVFLQAELGTAHMGDLKRAFDLIDAAKAAGMDAAKFIITDPEQVECPAGDPYTYDTAAGPVTKPIATLTQETTFTWSEWRQIRDYCQTKDIIFFATVDHIGAVALAEALDMPAYKICAWDLGYRELLAAVGHTGKPVIIDVGATNIEELGCAGQMLGKSSRLWLNAPHPHGDLDWNMSRIRWGIDALWGFSSPGRDLWCDFVALGRGAVALEKRMTLDRQELRGHHHWIALDPPELADWVRQVRLAERTLVEDPWAATEGAWAARKRYDRTLRMPDGRVLRHGP